VILHQIDPARNRKRFYLLRVNRTLYGEWSLQREWGRVGQPGAVRLDTFPTERQAMRAAMEHATVRYRHGYRS
jgi:predicted DNA-binding WGR domain protein